MEQFEDNFFLSEYIWRNGHYLADHMKDQFHLVMSTMFLHWENVFSSFQLI